MEYVNKTERMNTFATAYDKYYQIGDDSDLAKNKLTLAEHSIVYAGLQALSKIDGSEFDTFCTGAANWFKRNGFLVTKHGIGYKISI